MEEEMSLVNVTDSNDERNRRKVIFRSDDMHFSDLDESDTQNDDESDDEDIAPVSEEDNDSDSEWSDSEDETENIKDVNDKSRFYGQSFGKENEIRKKIANELAKLDKINQESNVNKLNELETDYSDDSMEYDEDSDVQDDSEDEEEDIESGNSDENEDSSEINHLKKTKDSKISLLNKFPGDNLQETNEDTTLNWKKNLAQKAANSYYERQNSVANLWKLVYGNFVFIFLFITF